MKVKSILAVMIILAAITTLSNNVFAQGVNESKYLISFYCTSDNLNSEINKDDQNIIKAHIVSGYCSGYYVTYTLISGGYTERTGPTPSNCITGTLGNPPQGYYKVEAYDGCHYGYVNNVWHAGTGFTDVYITPTEPCQ